MPFCTFVNTKMRMRFGIVHSEIKFPFASALTFRYLCHSKIISKNKYL